MRFESADSMVHPHVQMNITKPLRALPPIIAKATSFMSSLGSPTLHVLDPIGFKTPSSPLGSIPTSHFLFRSFYTSCIRTSCIYYYRCSVPLDPTCLLCRLTFCNGRSQKRVDSVGTVGKGSKGSQGGGVHDTKLQAKEL